MEKSYLLQRIIKYGDGKPYLMATFDPTKPITLIEQLASSKVFVPTSVAEMLGAAKDGMLHLKACLISENNTDELYEKYDIVVGKILHMFTEENLPECLRLKLGMIKLMDGAVEPTCKRFSLRPEEMFDLAPSWLGEYPHMAQIGWRVDRDLYTVLLTEDEMAFIQNRSANDARRKSKSKG